MKKLITSALAALGVASSAQAAQVETVDVKSIRFTMPTVAADQIEFVMPTKESFDGSPQFHEDEWRQLEFFPAERLAEIKQKLSEYKVFERAHRTPNGWTEIYARRLGYSNVISGKGALAQVEQAVGGKRNPAPILTTTSRPLGQVKGGFTLGLNGGVFLYGLTNDGGVGVLAAMVERGGDDTQLTRAFTTLNRAYKLILVDWRSQMLLVSVAPSGELNVWRP
ncbi:hypothetical protein [Methyloversatilis discipulorum]|uniref:hypothetical protein n=1 Tax=Methyloversatilis discipulorum TaxID=1119528 RepID=UPI000361746F|nr:hypothetical protein [Methyloversatilis discipulorum]